MSESKENRIQFISEDHETVDFCVLEQTTLNGCNYLLVSEDTVEEEADALILKEVSAKDAEEAVYSIVEDENELAALAGIFSELLEDVEIDNVD